MNRERSPQKTMPIPGRETKLVSNVPDTLLVPKETEPKLSTYWRGNISPTSNNFRSRKVHKNGQTVSELVPLIKKPVIPVFTISTGGGRVYGGGTSEEALRRARQKARR